MRSKNTEHKNKPTLGKMYTPTPFSKETQRVCILWTATGLLERARRAHQVQPQKGCGRDGVVASIASNQLRGNLYSLSNHPEYVLLFVSFFIYLKIFFLKITDQGKGFTSFAPCYTCYTWPLLWPDKKKNGAKRRIKKQRFRSIQSKACLEPQRQ